MAELGGFAAGGVRVSSPIWLAPLAGVTTATFRAFHREMGAALAHTEMISSTGLSYGNKKTFRMAGDAEEPGPLVIQIFGPNADDVARGAETALSVRRFNALEINMACPMPKVTKKCGGASLLSNPDEAARMVRALKAFSLPVWAKLRMTDPRAHPLPTGDFCSLLMDSGAELLLLHGRTPAQRYDGVADRASVVGVAAKFPGMIAASGDFYSPEDAGYYLDGGAAAVVAARGVLKDAFLIPKTLKFLGFPTKEKFLRSSVREQVGLLIAYGKLAKKNEGESCALVMTRRLLSGMLKGVRGASSLRRDCSSLGSWDSLEEVLADFARRADS